MRILIDIGHPGHVHLFRPFAQEMKERGHQILFTYRQKEFERELLQAAGLPARCFGRHYKSKIGKIWGLLRFNLQMLRSIFDFKPEILLSHGSIYAAQMAWLTRKTHISLEDTGNWEQVRLYLPFTRYVLTSDVFPINYGKKQIRYVSHHELAYLHPNRYTSDPDFIKTYDIEDISFAILRFVSWNATHDVGQKGLSLEAKRKIIHLLEKYHYKVFISSEASLPEEFEQYRITFPPDKIHHALYYASMFIGEGTTMAMEAAALGTPSIYVNSLQYSNIDDLKKAGLIISLSTDEKLELELTKLLKTKDLNKLWKDRRQNMLKHKIDFTAFLIWFIENYPKSITKFQEEPNIQHTFS